MRDDCMHHEKLTPKLKIINNISMCYPLNKYQTQLEQYIYAHLPNIVDNTPETIIEKLKEFYPELTSTFDEIVKL